MPSPLHENLIEVFRARPELAAELLSNALGVAIPEHDEVRRAWCAGPIQLGVSGSQITPMVVSLDLLPFATDAMSVPELAVLSAIAHGGEEDRREVLRALLRSLAGIKAERRQLYFGLVYGVLPEAARRYLEEIMSTDIDQEFSPYERRILVSRRAQILARAILTVLEARRVAVPDDRRQLIDECTDLDQLDRWVRRAATATTVEELFD